MQRRAPVNAATGTRHLGQKSSITTENYTTLRLQIGQQSSITTENYTNLQPDVCLPHRAAPSLRLVCAPRPLTLTRPPPSPWLSLPPLPSSEQHRHRTSPSPRTSRFCSPPHSARCLRVLIAPQAKRAAILKDTHRHWRHTAEKALNPSTSAKAARWDCRNRRQGGARVAGAGVGAEVGLGGLELSAFSMVAAHQSAQTSVSPSSKLSRSIWVWLSTSRRSLRD